TDKDSIMGRAVTLFNEVTVRPFNFKIKLDKKIPVSAGMGGGSSDAATLLMAMNDLTGKKLSTGTLCDIGRKLGADVPFFIMNASFAIGRGRGDILETIESHIKMWHVVVTPPVGVSTKEVYAKVTPQCLTKKGDTDRMFTSFLKEGKIRGIAENLRNDLQDITLREFPIIGEVFSEISNLGAGGVLLSGSGPTVFGVFDEEGAKKAAKELAAKFSSKKGWAVFVAHTL
ncbi:MAG TPA: 4-(cytidine 5'-diphospho)-2-C-methyl-D-erythritol kinase, partial [Candidatus Omnitrophota bacterium]|nr:4-(cytidine 5'-diphospho)-2-C-methyl-D-erythritol kinase [Candidatus Omnitrophota bacterium]